MVKTYQTQTWNATIMFINRLNSSRSGQKTEKKIIRKTGHVQSPLYRIKLQIKSRIELLYDILLQLYNKYYYSSPFHTFKFEFRLLLTHSTWKMRFIADW